MARGRTAHKVNLNDDSFSGLEIKCNAWWSYCAIGGLDRVRWTFHWSVDIMLGFSLTIVVIAISVSLILSTSWSTFIQSIPFMYNGLVCFHRCRLGGRSGWDAAKTCMSHFLWFLQCWKSLSECKLHVCSVSFVISHFVWKDAFIYPLSMLQCDLSLNVSPVFSLVTRETINKEWDDPSPEIVVPTIWIGSR